MLYPPLYVRLPRESFGTDQDGLLLRARGGARRARLGSVFPLCGPRRYAWLGPCRDSAVQDAAGPRSVPVPGHTCGPRVRPTRLDPGVPYRSLLVRDGALAATVVAVMVGITLFLTTALQATVLAGA